MQASGSEPRVGDGRAPRRFSTTRWSLVTRAAEPDGKRALSALCRAYWCPVQAFIRGYGVSPEDADEVTQELFERLVSSNGIARVDRTRGQFRSWLRTCARNHLFNWLAHRRGLAAGGRAIHVSMDTHVSALRDELTPERIFDRRFALTVLDRALTRLRQRYERANKAAIFEHLHRSITEGACEMDDRELSLVLAKSVAAIKVERHRLKQRFQESLREEIAETVAGPEDVEEELRRLIDALA